MSSHEERLRAQRDRFLAFAFAGADALVELDERGVVRWCAGATEAITGRPAARVIGQPFADTVHPHDRLLLRHALLHLKPGRRLERLKVRFHAPQAALGSMMLTAIRMDSGHSTHIAIARPPTPDVLSPDAFADMVGERLRQGQEAGRQYALTLLDVPEELLNSDHADEFMASVESFLRASSVGGNSAGRLDTNKFGAVVSDGDAAAGLQQRITELAGQAMGGTVELHPTLVQLDPDGLSQEDVAKALVYTVNKFVEQGGEEFSLQSLTEGYQETMRDALGRVATFRNIITSDRLTFHFQPIVDLASWEVHHYEALARIVDGGKSYLPSSFITFAEDIGVVSEMDLQVCRRAFALLADGGPLPAPLRMAVNLSGRSLSTPQFVDHLLELVSTNQHLLPRIMFELTESSEVKDLAAANRVLQRLRDLGCPVCLDDFGAGAAAFHYLRALDVDFVKIDGAYIVDVTQNSQSRAFLRAITGLCADLGIETIAEMVEDEATVRLIRDTGVQHGQGFYFARPAASVEGQVLPPRAEG